jgi:histidine triad (HIT) family protein
VTNPPDCEFCAIASGKSDAEIVCDGEHWVAFFPLAPATPGHTLIIPRAHVKDLWEPSNKMGRELMAAAIEVGRAIKSALEPDGMNLITSAGAAAEQTVSHLHLHVVPRWDDDGFGEIWPPKKHIKWATKHDAAAQIRAAFAERSTAEDDDGGRP